MHNINRVELFGVILNDPLTVLVDDGKRYTEFSLLTNERVNGKEYNEVHICLAWNGLSDIAQKMKKMNRVLLTGSLHYKINRESEIKCHEIIIMDNKNEM